MNRCSARSSARYSATVERNAVAKRTENTESTNEEVLTVASFLTVGNACAREKTIQPAVTA